MQSGTKTARSHKHTCCGIHSHSCWCRPTSHPKPHPTFHIMSDTVQHFKEALQEVSGAYVLTQRMLHTWHRALLLSTGMHTIPAAHQAWSDVTHARCAAGSTPNALPPLCMHACVRIIERRTRTRICTCIAPAQCTRHAEGLNAAALQRRAVLLHARAEASPTPAYTNARYPSSHCPSRHEHAFHSYASIPMHCRGAWCHD